MTEKEILENVKICRNMVADMVSNPEENPWTHTRRFAERLNTLLDYVEEDVSDFDAISPTALRLLISFLQNASQDLPYPDVVLGYTSFGCSWKEDNRKLLLGFYPDMQVSWVMYFDDGSDHDLGDWKYSDGKMDFKELSKKFYRWFY